MVKRNKNKFKSLKIKISPSALFKPSSARSVRDISPKVHPSTNDCYPLNKLCRLCLLSNTNMEPIFSYPGDNLLAHKIAQCTGLEITENTDQGIPSSICGQCKKQLEQCHEFRLLCWKNNEVLHNLHAILSPKKPKPPALRANPVVQLEKLDLNSSHLNCKEIDLQQLYSPVKQTRSADTPQPKIPNLKTPKKNEEQQVRKLYSPLSSNKKTKNAPALSKELVVCLTPVSSALINKYKKAPLKPVTQTKAAVKSFPLQIKSRGRPLKIVRKPVIKIAKRTFKPLKPSKPAKPAKPAKTPATQAKKQKAKQVEIAVPPKKRKQNFESTPAAASVVTVTCTLCTQTFNNEKNLNRHMATHENSRKQNRVFNCDVCNKEYLKASQLTDHLRSAEHIKNAGANVLDEADVSILPDESAEISILPDNDEESIGHHDLSSIRAHDSVGLSRDEEMEDYQSAIRSPPSPDTNDLSQQPASIEDEQQGNGGFQSEIIEPSIEEDNVVRDVSPVVSESYISRIGGVQYSDVCSTNNAENLFNGSGVESLNSSRRVTFSDITEIVE
ncbi:uncharacterized protein LOC129777116 isoform X2 [Toxorhynchites rutilus septentrionalis]|uniref:uncharacterized protein LOC129777116 isoform X2 n=1 Tax=Toxorhynchites rutilus septentrionalis TaxID=329112 RepID=UPI002479495A|nr:uncharacterized protein LOC129777116 isoform X2 [Toxorhynchites rutilus septentrionalis]